MSVGVLFILFVIFLIIAIPVGITLGITAVLPHIFDPSFTVGAKYLIRAMFGGLDSFPLLAVPRFVLSGIIMAKGGISRKIFDVFAYFFGRSTAGMPCAVIVTCLFYGAISGSAPATVAAVGSMTAPILIGLGYDKTFNLWWPLPAAWVLSSRRAFRSSCTAWLPAPPSATCSWPELYRDW